MLLSNKFHILCFRFLSTGSSYRSLAFSFRMSHSTISLIVKDVCKAIWHNLVSEHMAQPSEEDIKGIAKCFFEKWGFPNCFGAIDGTHIRLKCPSKSGSMYYNYKLYFSIVLQALVDANYRFICIEVGAFGKQSDGGIFEASNLHSLLEGGQFNVPPAALLPASDIEAPYVMIGDEAYPQRTYLLRPFPRSCLTKENIIFNQNLSKSRNAVECAFGLLKSKWRILTKAIETNVEVAKTITKSVCLLHNIIIDKEGLDKSALLNVQQNTERSQNQTYGGTRPSFTALNIRNLFRQYFLGN